jgi:hypothetical protein
VVKVQWNGKSSTSSLDLTSFFFASLHIWPWIKVDKAVTRDYFTIT